MGARPELDRRPIHFGVFDLNPLSGELRKYGVRVRLQDQPLKLLLCLLETPGEICTREELIGRLWPTGTFVDFDRGLNVAVTRLRQALGDSADAPRYVETVGRKGYRFIAPVERVQGPEQALPALERIDPPAAVHLHSVAVAHTTRPSWLWPGIAIAATILAAAAAFGWWRARQTTLRPLVRLNVAMDAEMTALGAGTSLALSPDGTRLAVTVRGADGVSRLATRGLDQSQLTLLPGTEGANSPFFSPDGRWVAFFAGGKLQRVSVEGGQAIAVCHGVGLFNGGSWGDDGNIIAALNFGLYRVSSAGGTPVRMTEIAPGEIIHRWPQVLPGSKAVLFTAYTSVSGLEGGHIEVMSLRDRRPKTVLRGGTWARYLASGHLVYIDKGILLAVPFDLGRLEVRGVPVPVLEGVAYSTASGSAELDVSQTGALVYRTSRTAGGLVIVQWLDSSGKTRPLLAVPGNYLSPTLSPDGNTLALTSAGDIWVYDMRREIMTRLTVGSGYGNPLWSADGRYIVFRAARGMYWTRADGTGQPQPLTRSNQQQIPWSFTGDGRRLAFVEPNSQTGADIWTVPVDTDRSGLRAGKPEVFLQTPSNERSPMFSPDGRWIAYQSDESGAGYQVYLRPFPANTGRQQISTDGGTLPSWSRNGHELFFWHSGADRHLMVAPYQVQGDSFLVEKPRMWTEKRIALFTTTRSYDPAPDGKSIVALMPADGPDAQDPQGQVVFLLNFIDELRRRVPVNRN
jgi:serine/threonine-protein kinase